MERIGPVASAMPFDPSLPWPEVKKEKSVMQLQHEKDLAEEEEEDHSLEDEYRDKGMSRSDFYSGY